MTAPDPITLASASGQPWTTVTPAAPAAGSGLVYAAGQPLASVASRIPPYAEAIGFAGATITLATVAMVSSDIAAALSAVTTGLRGQSVASFVTGAHPGTSRPTRSSNRSRSTGPTTRTGT